MAEQDPLTLAEEAQKEALDMAVESLQFGRAMIVRPAIGEKMTKPQRLQAHEQFFAEPALQEMEYDEMAARFRLEPGQVPRRWVDRARMAARELRKEGRLGEA